LRELKEEIEKLQEERCAPRLLGTTSPLLSPASAPAVKDMVWQG